MENTDGGAKQRRLGLGEEGNRIASWAERGFNEEAMVVYGTQIGVLKQILSTGQIPPLSPDVALLDYQQYLMKNNKFVYYAMPFVDRIAKVKPDIAREVAERFSKDYPISNPHHYLRPENIRRAGKFYALVQSIEAAFQKKTGIAASKFDVLILAHKLLPEEFARFAADISDTSIIYGDIEEIKDNQDQDVQKTIRARFNDKQLIETITSVLKRRGVLIYFNSGIFAKHKVVFIFKFRF